MMSKEQKQIDTAWVLYQRDIERIADHILATKVKPYFKRHNIAFVNGMGTYYLSRDGVDVDPYSLPKWLQDILDMEIPGMASDSLGTVMNVGA